MVFQCISDVLATVINIHRIIKVMYMYLNLNIDNSSTSCLPCLTPFVDFVNFRKRYNPLYDAMVGSSPNIYNKVKATQPNNAFQQRLRMMKIIVILLILISCLSLAISLYIIIVYAAGMCHHTCNCMNCLYTVELGIHVTLTLSSLFL